MGYRTGSTSHDWPPTSTNPPGGINYKHIDRVNSIGAMVKLKTKFDQLWSNLSKDDRQEIVSHASRLAAYTDPAK